MFPWLALRIEKVTLGNPPGYGSEPFATVEQASVGVKLLPLLRQQVEVSRVAVEGLAIELISRSDTENNWKDLAEAEEEAAETEASRTPSIAGVDVTRSQLLYRDAAAKSVTRLANLELHAGRIGGDRPVPLQLEFDLDQGEGETPLHVKLDTLARLPPDTSRIELADLVLEGRRGDTPFAVRTPSLQLDWESEQLAPAELDVTFAALPIRISAAGEKLFSDRLIRGTLSVADAKPRDILRSLEIDAPNTSDPDALSKLALSGDYRLTENALRLSELDLTLDETRVRGTVGIEDIEKFVLAFDLAVGRVDVDR